MQRLTECTKEDPEQKVAHEKVNIAAVIIPDPDNDHERQKERCMNKVVCSYSQKIPGEPDRTSCRDYEEGQQYQHIDYKKDF